MVKFVIVLILLIGGLGTVFVERWRRKKRSVAEGEGSTPAFDKASMASFLKGVLNCSLILVIFGLFMVFVTLGYSFFCYYNHNEIRMGEAFSIVFDDKEAQGTERVGVDDKQNVNIQNGRVIINEEPVTFLLSFGLRMIVLASYIIPILLLRKFFHSLSNQKIFVGENATRLRWLGLTIVAFELALGILKCANHQYFIYRHKAEGLPVLVNVTGFGLELNFFRLEIFFIGFAILVIAEVFRCGVEMKEEQDLTV